MTKYYTRACNFFYGHDSRQLVKKNLSLPLCNDNSISFNQIELFSRNKKIIKNKTLDLKNIKKLPKKIKEKVIQDLKKITSKREFLGKKSHAIMGVVNMTPDSFSDGGKFTKKNLAEKHSKKLIKDGCDILDIGGEATNPGSKDVDPKNEWKRIFPTLYKIKKLKKFISLDTRKSFVMENGIKNNINLINDVSGLEYDPSTIRVLKKTNISFVIHHMQGEPSTMQKNPKYKNVLLDIYDYFEEKIKYLRSEGIMHNNIILDPGIGFGKKLKHNITLLRNISIFHSLGFPVMLGTSRKRFIKDLSGVNDSKQRLGGTIASSLIAIMQGVQILRVHDVNEVKQSIKVFKSLKF